MTSGSPVNGDMMSGHWLRHMSPGHRARSGSCRMAACICAKILDLHIYLYRGLKIRSITQFALSPPILYYSLCMLYVYVLMGRDGLMHNKVSIYLSMKCSIASGSISSQKPAFFSLTLQSRSMIHRHTEIWK